MGGRLGGLFVNNLGIKFLSVLSAVFLWLMVVGQERTEVGLIVPVELSRIPESLVIEGSALEFVHVRLAGSRAVIQKIAPQQVQVNLDLENLKPGENFVPITSREIELPRGATLVGITPPYIHVRTATRRLVPIRVALRGRPDEGFEVGHVTSIPSSIYIIGAQAKVRAVREVETYPIDIRGARAALRVSVNLIPPEGDIRIMEMKATEVAIEIRERGLERTFSGLTVETGVEGLHVRPSRVTVTVTGPASLVKAVVPSQVRVEVDPRGITPGQPVERRLRVSVPDGVEVTETIPETVELTGKEP